MCGITGYLDTEAGVCVDVLKRMNDVIRHRGPDDEGYVLIGSSGQSAYSGPDTVPSLRLPPLELSDGTSAFLGMGHRRLSILDLTESGHQPMCLSDRDLSIVYNGEIYNFIELRSELLSLGYEFRTSCDTEVLLAAYCEWGEDCLSHFNGMWGFALWDGRENKLFCARDRLGAKPLHYWHSGNRFVFGSELKQLCQPGAIPSRRFDYSYLAANLIYHISDFNDQTLVDGVHSLQPGHKLVVHLSDDRSKILSVAVSPYWELSVNYDHSVSPEEWYRQVAEEFSRSCQWRLRSDAPLAALLSGGLDSSCMVTELCGHLPDPAALQTFTTSYPGRADCDEWAFADMVNQSCGCQGHQIVPDPCDGIEKRFENVIWHCEGFSGLSLLGPKYLLDHIHDLGYKVVLNGQCGDETMLGYERYYTFFFSELIKQRQIKKLWQEYQLAGRNSKLSLRTLTQMMAYFNLPVIRDTRQIRRAGRFVSQDVLARRNTEELHRLLYPKTMEQLQKIELTATQLTHIVRYDDRLYMSASVESRIPFMDYRFVELASRIPSTMKIKDGYTKHIMRVIFDSRLPKEVTWRTNKMGFGAPTDRWAAAFSRDYLMAQLDSAKTTPYFNIDFLKRTVVSSPTDASIFEFLQTEQFARQFDVS